MVSDQDAPYEFTYTVPADAPNGYVLVTAKVVDDAGRTGTDSVGINVDNPNNQVSIEIYWPSQGATLNSTTNQKIEAAVSGANPSSVLFVINGPNGYNWQASAQKTGNSWRATWDDNSAPNGNYSFTVSADGKSDGVTFKVQK